MDPQSYVALHNKSYVAVVMLNPPDCANCAELASFWEQTAKKSVIETWSVDCAKQPAICVDRAVGGERRGAREVFALPDAQPSFQAWTEARTTGLVTDTPACTTSPSLKARFGFSGSEPQQCAYVSTHVREKVYSCAEAMLPIL